MYNIYRKGVWSKVYETVAMFIAMLILILIPLALLMFVLVEFK